MLNITKEQEELLQKYMPNYKESTDFFADLDEVMLESLDENDKGTDDTTVIAQLYDQIYAQN